MQPHPKKLERSQTCRIKYNIWYPIYPANQGPTINNKIKIHSYFYWWHCYLLVVQQSLPQWGSHHSLFGLTGSLTIGILIWSGRWKPTVELNKFYNYAAVKLLSLPQARARKLINPNPKVLQGLSQRTLLRAPVRASLSLYVPAHVTHANGSPLSIN